MYKKQAKAIYHDDDTEKFQDSDTGAHFRHKDIVKRLFVAKEERKILELKLGIFYDGTESSSHLMEMGESAVA